MQMLSTNCRAGTKRDFKAGKARLSTRGNAHTSCWEWGCKLLSYRGTAPSASPILLSLPSSQPGFPSQRDMAIAESLLSAPQVDAKEVPGAAASAPAIVSPDRTSCCILSPLLMCFPRKKEEVSTCRDKLNKHTFIVSPLFPLFPLSLQASGIQPTAPCLFYTLRSLSLC